MRKFNFDEFIWFIIQIALLAMMIFLINTGIMNSFIDEKMTIYLYISLVILTVYIVGQLFRIISIPSRIYITNKFFPIISVIALTVTFFYIMPSYTMIVNGDIENSNSLLDIEVITIDNSNFNLLYKDKIKDIIGEVISFKGTVKEVDNDYVILYRDVVTCCQSDKIKLELLINGSNFTEDNIGDFIEVVGEVKDFGKIYIDVLSEEIVDKPLDVFFHE